MSTLQQVSEKVVREYFADTLTSIKNARTRSDAAEQAWAGETAVTTEREMRKLTSVISTAFAPYFKSSEPDDPSQATHGIKSPTLAPKG